MQLLTRCVLRYLKSLREVIFGFWGCSRKFPYKFNGNCSFALCHFSLENLHVLLLDSNGKPVTVCINCCSSQGMCCISNQERFFLLNYHRSSPDQVFDISFNPKIQLSSLFFNQLKCPKFHP